MTTDKESLTVDPALRAAEALADAVEDNALAPIPTYRMAAIIRRETRCDEMRRLLEEVWNALMMCAGNLDPGTAKAINLLDNLSSGERQ